MVIRGLMVYEAKETGRRFLWDEWESVHVDKELNDFLERAGRREG